MEGQTATCGWAVRSWPEPGSAGGSCRGLMPPLTPVDSSKVVVDIVLWKRVQQLLMGYEVESLLKITNRTQKMFSCVHGCSYT
jgi:hypothetical protein